MVKDRLQALRKLMKREKIDAYLVPSTDPHQNEYVPALWERRKWLSGFSGSAGDLAITLKKAGLWTDSRYFLQAETQLQGSGISLFKIGLKETATIAQWLKQELQPGSRVGIDPRVISLQESGRLSADLAAGNLRLKPVKDNLVDRIWSDQPAFPEHPIRMHPVKYAGEPLAQKLGRLREKMKQERVKAHVITHLDGIAWLFNIRGRDIDYNPLVISYAIVTPKNAFLFTRRSKVTDAVTRHLGETVTIREEKDFHRTLKKLGKSDGRIWLDPGLASWWVADTLGKNADLLLKETPITRFKAVKNPTEIKGLRSAHLRDGAAMVKFLCWLETALTREKVTELSVAERLAELRAEQDRFQGLSFSTISAYQAHGAIVHYSATPESDVRLRPRGLYLIDSGAHYLDGTTDITRTIALGNPSREQRERFTRVLKGHIQLATTRFPAGTAGNQLDTIARKPLWDIGLNYGHGTGHGIGSYLNVHEGPHAISYYRGIGVALEPGMVISNEPGYYKTGEYGIRIENLVLTIIAGKKSETDPDFLTFETVTCCPIDLRLVEKSLLQEGERKWLNDYHARVRKELTPLLKQAESRWLAKATAAI